MLGPTGLKVQNRGQEQTLGFLPILVWCSAKSGKSADMASIIPTSLGQCWVGTPLRPARMAIR
jgi:hypothetical protein